jgi:hypothetical protein
MAQPTRASLFPMLQATRMRVAEVHGGLLTR